jgi:hypothetical protein
MVVFVTLTRLMSCSDQSHVFFMAAVCSKCLRSSSSFLPSLCFDCKHQQHRPGRQSPQTPQAPSATTSAVGHTKHDGSAHGESKVTRVSSCHPGVPMTQGDIQLPEHL